MSMYGAGVLQREHWPLWMLVAAVLSGLMALTSGGRVSSSSGLKLVSRVPEAGADATQAGALAALGGSGACGAPGAASGDRASTTGRLWHVGRGQRQQSLRLTLAVRQ